MHASEQLTTAEKELSINQPVEIVLQHDTVAAQAALVTEARQQQLDMIKLTVSLKFFHELSEKVKREQEKLREFIIGSESKQERAKQYSHILSETYFDQLFF